jgi:hypothetical protein
MDIINRPVFYLKHDISESGVCLRLKVELIQMGPIEKTILCICSCLCCWCPETETSSFYCAYLDRFHLKTEIESSLRNVVFLNKRLDDG